MYTRDSVSQLYLNVHSNQILIERTISFEGTCGHIYLYASYALTYVGQLR